MGVPYPVGNSLYPVDNRIPVCRPQYIIPQDTPAGCYPQDTPTGYRLLPTGYGTPTGYVIYLQDMFFYPQDMYPQDVICVPAAGVPLYIHE